MYQSLAIHLEAKVMPRIDGVSTVFFIAELDSGFYCRLYARQYSITECSLLPLCKAAALRPSGLA